MNKRYRFATVLVAIVLCAQQASAQNTAPHWSLSGNNNATLSHKIGTTNNVSLRFVTNNLERMKIHAGGNVGIGTASPSQKLHVAGKGLFTAGLIVNDGGILATNTEANSTGIYGSGDLIGVSGSGSLWAVLGTSDGGVGVSGQSNSFTGVSGLSYDGRGVAGESGSSDGVFGISQTGYGVNGYSESSHGGNFESENDWGIRARTINGSYAGVFYGKVWSSGGYVTSDKRLKQNVRDFNDAMSLINKLKPRYYEFKTDNRYAFLNLAKGSQYGLLAQDVEEVLPNLVSTADHKVLKPVAPPVSKRNADGMIAASPKRQAATEKPEIVSLKAVNYTGLIPIMVKGMQEQEQRLQRQEQLIATQQQQIDDLKILVRRLTENKGSNTSAGSGALEQATPNPANSTTRIAYRLPQDAAQGHLLLTDNNGKTVKTISLTASGVVDINTASLSSGVYHYSLMVAGQIVETKKLTVHR
jgi:hypothetical protein